MNRVELYCFRCKRPTEAETKHVAGGTLWHCKECGAQVDEYYDDDDYFDAEDACTRCGGEGTAEYQDCPEAWGEDCPSLVNHLITCPHCNGTGREP